MMSAFSNGRFLVVVSSLMLVMGLVLSGCSSSDSPEGLSEGQTEMSHQGMSHEGAAADDGQTDAMAKMKENLADLSDEDRTAAEKQHVCPVSGEMLGSMGVPLKVTVKDQDVWLCCSGCEEKLKNDPDTYLAKLAK